MGSLLEWGMEASHDPVIHLVSLVAAHRSVIHLLHGKVDGAVFLLPLFNPLTGLVTDTPNTPLYTSYTPLK